MSEATRAPRLEHVSLRGLFGSYDYDIHVGGASSSGDVTVLYGDNGSGKTTILNLLFHALSPTNDRGHRGAILSIPFERFELVLSDGLSLSLAREKPTTGPYEIVLRDSNGELRGSFFGSEAKGFGSPQFESAFITRLEKIGLPVFLLSDNRQIYSDVLPQPSREPRVTVDEAGRVIQVRGRETGTGLASTIHFTQEWIKTQALHGSTQGSLNANTIYMDLIERIMDTQMPAGSSLHDLDSLFNALKKLEQQSQEYAQFGFVPPVRLGALMHRLHLLKPDKRTLVTAVLEPFVSGLRARLEGVGDITRAISLFVKELNEFYVNKQVTFHVNSGFQFVDRQGRVLQPQWLSSGERHLLMLFCYTLISRERPCVFIIDEPELSLNVKWQRGLITALSDLVAGSGSQFLFASHSVELLAQHRKAVVDLNAQLHSGPIE